MNCDRLREVLIEHVDGLLDAEDAEGARAHLIHCAPCNELRDEVRRGFAALDAWEDEELPEGAWERMAARLPAGALGGVLPAAAMAGSPVPVTGTGPVTGTTSAAPPRMRALRSAALPYVLGLATAAVAVVAVQSSWAVQTSRPDAYTSRPLPSSSPGNPGAGHEPPTVSSTGPVAAPDTTTISPGVSAELPLDPAGALGGHRGSADRGGALPTSTLNRSMTARPSPLAPASREPGADFVERPLRFADFDRGVMRVIRLPAGVDPDTIEVVPVPSPAPPSRGVH